MDGLKKNEKTAGDSSSVFLLGIAEVASAINQLLIWAVAAHFFKWI